MQQVRGLILIKKPSQSLRLMRVATNGGYLLKLVLHNKKNFLANFLFLNHLQNPQRLIKLLLP
jgi:hypothetical protein